LRLEPQVLIGSPLGLNAMALAHRRKTPQRRLTSACSPINCSILRGRALGLRVAVDTLTEI
jgi:hypothetical protein